MKMLENAARRSRETEKTSDGAYAFQLSSPSFLILLTPMSKV